MQEAFWTKKIAFPFFSSSFESHFCLASLSCESLEMWKESYLHPLEVTEYENLTNDRRKHDYLLRNYCAKQVILSCLKKPLSHAKHFQINKNIINQGILTCDRLYYSHLQVSVTHSETLGFAIAFEGLYPLGIDLEKINLKKADSIRSVLSFEEKKLIQDFDYLKEKDAISLWTAKESLCKALGGSLEIFSEITQILSILSHQGYTEVIFKYFSGHRAYNFFFADYVITIAFPYTKRFEVDLGKTWKELKSDIDHSFAINPGFGNEFQHWKKVASNS